MRISLMDSVTVYLAKRVEIEVLSLVSSSESLWERLVGVAPLGTGRGQKRCQLAQDFLPISAKSAYMIHRRRAISLIGLGRVITEGEDKNQERATRVSSFQCLYFTDHSCS